MTGSRFLQVHTLTSYSGVLLNRDDVGFAKRIPFGGVVRTRVSSQCLKRHWRNYRGDGDLASIGPDMSIRSRSSFERYVLKPLKGEVDEKVAEAIVSELKSIVLGAKADSDDDTDEAKAKKGSALQTSQVTVLGRPELEYLLHVTREIAAKCDKDPKRAKKTVKEHLGNDGLTNLRALKRGAGLDAALFGRMVTGDVLARCDAAIHVAHAFTVHEEAAESDYFSAVDDLAQEAGETGSGHIGSSELTSGLLYGYIVVDVPLLVSNLEGCGPEEWLKADRKLAAEVVRRLIRIAATVTPGAKRGSTAPYARAHLVAVECGSAQPCSLANAFLQPISGGPGLVDATYRALAAHIKDIEAMYGVETRRRFAALEPVDAVENALGERLDVARLAAWAAQEVSS